MLAIATYATKSYCYAIAAQAPLVVANIRTARIDPKDVLFLFVSDESKEAATAGGLYKVRMEAMGAAFDHIALKVGCNENGQHAKASNLVIARLQDAAFDAARVAGVSQYWSLEADVLPQPNALRTLQSTLAFDGGEVYDVAMCTYPNEDFLGGRGNPRQWIAPNHQPAERLVPARLAECLRYRDVCRKAGIQPSAAEAEWWAQLDREHEACPPKGNVWQLNAEGGWQQRGWLSHCYPGIGQGAIVPTEWVGVGCTLLSERALHAANFIGYDGGCTQDLWLCWRAWQSIRLRLATTTHAICSHVKMKLVKEPRLGKDGKPVIGQDGKPEEIEVKRPFIHHAHHEIGGQRDGHLNNHTRPWDGL